MFDVTNFLMRWLFLSNLIQSSPEIQTMPHNPHFATTPASLPHSHPPPAQRQQVQQQQQPYHDPPTDSQWNAQSSYYSSQTPQTTGSSHVMHQRAYPPPQHLQQQQSPLHQRTIAIGSGSTSSVSCEDEWREQCLREILSYPPGTQRLLMMDAMRAELVQRLAWSLRQADETLEAYEACRRRDRVLAPINDPDDDADVEFRQSLEQGVALRKKNNNESKSDLPRTEVLTDEKDPVVIISKNRTSSKKAASKADASSSTTNQIVRPSEEAVDDALRTARAVRDYLPQLVSIVLKSPPAFDTNLLNPVDKLRQLIIQRCADDANWGVDLCWLLEAEVGRAWKVLFEDRQQTGRRYIVVLDAERAAVLKHIGTEKREAFDLLQDAEQATAFGYSTSTMNPNFLYGHQPLQPNRHQQHQQMNHPVPKRLPSSLSLRRCSHFGDTMHFIDRMTQLSLDLRHVPVIHRDAYLQQGLKEMNRRIRRRMVTRGDVSLDVEDQLGPDDWPRVVDVSADMIKYSVHLPLDPKQQKHWPGGFQSADTTDGGVVRVLNIVVEECRMLASRERCPYLVQLEVAETGIRGNDSRLYASGAPGLGATIGEALALSTSATSMAGVANHENLRPGNGRTSYHIPSELLAPTSSWDSVNIVQQEEDTQAHAQKMDLPRGGWQADEAMYYANSPDDVFASNPYDMVREDQYQQLHEQMQRADEMAVQPLQAPGYNALVSTREVLLDRVFGQKWAEKCEEIRQTSPYGKVEGWRLASFIMKAGEDIRREALVMQIISKLNDWYKKEIPESDRPHMRPYTIMSVGGDAGLVECLSDAKSIDELKKRTDNFQSLRDYFERAFGPPTFHSAHYQRTSRLPPSGTLTALTFEQAQENFLRSLVGYSLVCYILQIKDRHNANILLDRDGHLIHIDFGFVLGDTPKMGKVPIFSERAPFKLSPEFWDVLGGWNKQQGGLGIRFCEMFERAFACAAAHVDEIASLVEATMLTLTHSARHAQILSKGVRNRLRMRGAPGSKEQRGLVLELVAAAQTSWQTSTYDWLQKNMNGYQ